MTPTASQSATNAEAAVAIAAHIGARVGRRRWLYICAAAAAVAVANVAHGLAERPGEGIELPPRDGPG